MLKNGVVVGDKVRHIKRGTCYTVVCSTGKLQTAESALDDVILITYIGEDGQMWHRPIDEFTDGRFEKIS